MFVLRIQLLGDFRLVDGDEPALTVNTLRLQALLAYLVLHRHAPQSRQHVAFLFWPDTPEAQALTNLRNLLHKLRHALPDPDQCLLVNSQMVQWRSEAPFSLDFASTPTTAPRPNGRTRATDYCAGNRTGLSHRH
jgi:DNA-binding SARP family transcriptional activator